MTRQNSDSFNRKSYQTKNYRSMKSYSTYGCFAIHISNIILFRLKRQLCVDRQEYVNEKTILSLGPRR